MSMSIRVSSQSTQYQYEYWMYRNYHVRMPHVHPTVYAHFSTTEHQM